MGCDIHAFAEKKNDNGSYEMLPFSPFDMRWYGAFGFLADVRNYSAVSPISKPRGIPSDASNEVIEECKSWGIDGHSHSWLSVNELLEFNYDEIVEDRRVTRQISPGCISGACTCKIGEGEKTTWREFLGEQFISDIEILKSIGADRVVFWFDN